MIIHTDSDVTRKCDTYCEGGRLQSNLLIVHKLPEQISCVLCACVQKTKIKREKPKLLRKVYLVNLETVYNFHIYIHKSVLRYNILYHSTILASFAYL